MLVNLFLAIFIFLFCDSGYTAVGGLQTNFGLVVVENLQPGQKYNVRELTGLPLDIFNTGSERVTVKVDLLKPSTTYEPGMVRAGFEPIPDVSWVELGEDFFVIDPGQKSFTDVTIKIPDSDEYLGRKFQINLWIHMTDVKFLAPGLAGKLRFTVADKRLTPEQLKEIERATEKLKNINFSLLPHKVILEKFPLGKKIDIEKKYGIILKLVNPSEEKFKYSIKSISVKESMMGLYPGYEDTPSSDFLTFDENEFEVEPVSIKKIKMYLKFPDKKEFRKKHFMFIVKAQVLEQPVEFSVYSRILVDIEE